MQNWPAPQSTKDLRSFLGLAGYYRKFVKNFGIISKPLTNLLKKHEQFIWTSVHEEAFNALKSALVSAPVLALPDFTQQFIVETDASDKGVGAVLQQNGHPIAFVSKALGPRNQGLSIYEKECLAILMAIDHWRQYLMQGEFLILTDQKSLIHLDDQKLTTPWQHKALTKMLGLQYKICYRKGHDNKAADALSRLPPTAGQEVIAMSHVQPVWLQQLADGYLLHPETKKLLAALSLKSPIDDYSLKDGIIRYKSRIWVAHNPTAQNSILQALHSSPVGGHSGMQVTYIRVKNLFAWPGLKKMVQSFVANCQICQQAKTERVKYPGLLLL